MSLIDELPHYFDSASTRLRNPLELRTQDNLDRQLFEHGSVAAGMALSGPGIHGSSIGPQCEFDQDCNRPWGSTGFEILMEGWLGEPHGCGKLVAPGDATLGVRHRNATSHRNEDTKGAKGGGGWI